MQLFEKAVKNPNYIGSSHEEPCCKMLSKDGAED